MTDSNQSRSIILQKLKSRPAGKLPLQDAQVAESIQWSTPELFAASIASNGALITFESTEKDAFLTIKRLCDDNDWQQPPVIAPALLPFAKHLKLWGRENHDPKPTGTVAVTEAYCGIADTGTLLCLSSAQHPTGLNFLAEHHIVLLATKRLVASKLDALQLLNREKQATPRALNMISGPSRTADIEQTIQLGAHGPRSLTVILIG